jgi:2-polyprenyl-3-methyl-5-hydroxy-6-metoxy-1,4-benzoquinol methylase
MSDNKYHRLNEQDVTDCSRKFYEQFQFPGERPLDHDGLILMRRFYNSMRELLIQNRMTKVRVLDAGCGTGNTSVALANQFKEADFFGLDNSAPSLLKAKQLSEQKHLRNIHFRKWNLMKPIPYEEKFDVVLCLGVLHHTANMKRVLDNIYASLNDQGELFLWIYAKHGRYYHSLNLRLLSMLLDNGTLAQEKMKLTKEFINGINNRSPLDDLKGNKFGSAYDKVTTDSVWIADQFLNPIETLLDMEELIELISSASFEIVEVLGLKEDLSSYFSSPGLYERFSRLLKYRQYIALDLLLKPERHFVILKKVPNKKDC